MRHYDFIVVGAGIIGLRTAYVLSENHPDASILILEKEPQIGVHASGRNSGVLHSGIYYKKDSLKAKLCAKGARAIKQYCQEHNLPMQQCGKIILPLNAHQQETLSLLLERAHANSAKAEIIDAKELQSIEPMANNRYEKALLVPETAIIDPAALIQHISSVLVERQIHFAFNAEVTLVNPKTKAIKTSQGSFGYGHLYNCAGTFADKLYKMCEPRSPYTILPFKGIYYYLTDNSPVKINHLLYPVPDLNMPFLGIHVTKTIHGKTTIGPTAVPALGREHYSGIKGISGVESLKIAQHLFWQYLYNKQNFRSFTHQESLKFMKSRLIQSAQQLTPSLKPQDISTKRKVGIRAQLLDTQKKELIHDFLVKNTENETHILNAVSPALTSSFEFTQMVVGETEMA